MFIFSHYLFVRSLLNFSFHRSSFSIWTTQGFSFRSFFWTFIFIPVHDDLNYFVIPLIYWWFSFISFFFSGSLLLSFSFFTDSLSMTFCWTSSSDWCQSDRASRIFFSASSFLTILTGIIYGDLTSGFGWQLLLWTYQNWILIWFLFAGFQCLPPWIPGLLMILHASCIFTIGWCSAFLFFLLEIRFVFVLL